MRLLKKKNQERDYNLITQYNPKSAFVESYRALRTNLGFAGVDQDYHMIMVSSPSPQDGKSTTTANLAVVMAQAGNKVLLVDCDLRKPVQHRIFQVDNTRGFTNCLLHQMGIEEAAHRELVDNLTVLTSGPIPPNPAEILGSQRARDFWEKARKSFEYILIDAPPVLAVTDAVVLSTYADGVVLVVRSSVTRNELAREARDQLVRANARILGVVLNQVKMDAKDYYYYNYYGESS